MDGKGEFHPDDHYIYYCGQESQKRNGVTLIINKRIQNVVLGCNLKNDKMILIRFQGKSFNIMVVQAYAPTTDAKKAEVDEFCDDLHTTPSRTNTKRKDSLFIMGD